MDQQATNPIVLARIPDLRAVGPETIDGERLLSSGRLINQALSFKLLAGAVLLLMAMAVVPFLVKRSGTSADPPAVADPLATWQSASSAMPANPAPTSAVSESVMPIDSNTRQARLTENIMPGGQTFLSVPKRREKSDRQECLSSGDGKCGIASDVPQPAPASAETPLMSTWPNPAHPTSVSETSSDNLPARVNQAMAIRPTEYLRNSYDHTRSGIH